MVDSDHRPELKGPTVAASANQCLESFQKCLFRASSVHPRELSMAEDQLARFSSWAASIGVFAPGSASMDHRLRYASEVQSVVTGLLESLNYRVQTCSNALSTLAESSTIDASGAANERLGHSFLDIAAEITRLNKVSNTIRRASKETQVLKARNFQIKDDEDRDVEPLLLGHFEHHIGDWFPGISETVRQRLARAMLLRRKRILYRRHRQGNTSIESENAISQVSVTLPGAQSGAIPSVPAKLNEDDDKTPVETAVTTVAPSQVRSATTLAPEKFKMVSSSPSVVSASRTIASGKHQVLIYPAAPGFAAKQRYKQLKSRRVAEYSEMIGEGWRTTADPKLQELLKSDLQAIGEITCPYCLHALPAAEVFDERKWQKHLKNDLDPYVCVFEDCDQPDVLYTHSEEWLGHLHQHGKIWRCSSHREMGPFSTLAEYMRHMREVHDTKLSDRQLRAMASRNSRKTGKLFPLCPLCGAGESEVDGRLEDHLAGHLRSLALKSLPSYQDEVPDDPGIGNNSIDGSQPRSRSTLKEMEEEKEHMPPYGAESYWEQWYPKPTEGISWNFLGDAHRHLDLNDNESRAASQFLDSMIFRESSGSLEDDPILQSMLQQQKGRIGAVDDGEDNGWALPADQEMASSSKAPVSDISEERYVLQRLELSCKSEHLATPMATYETYGDNCPNEYHFISAAGGGTVVTLWTREALWRKARTADLSRWAARQCYGLAGALAEFHRFQMSEGDLNTKTTGIHLDLKPDNILWCRDWDVGEGNLNTKTTGTHGDLKPDNILWYRDWDVGEDDRRDAGRAAGGDERLGILRITDFRLSSFYSTGTVFDLKVTTSSDYTAPETERWLRHPPASDVWALGCLFLDFATWLVGGPEEYKAFVKQRKTRGAIVEGGARFSEFKQWRKRNLVEVVVSSKVVDHAAKLYRSKNASQFIRDLVSLVIHDMLVVEELEGVIRRPDKRRTDSGGRIASDEVKERLAQMWDYSTRDPSYYMPSKAKQDFRRPRLSAIRFVLTEEELRTDILAIHAQVKANMVAEGY